MISARHRLHRLALACAALAALSGTTRAATPAAETPLAFMQALYAPYRDGLQISVDRPFAPSLAALWHQVLRTAHQRDELPIDGDPICDCQDGAVTGLKLAVRATGAETALVAAEFKLDDKLPRALEFDLRLVGGRWRIDDIQDLAHRAKPLRQYLSDYLRSVPADPNAIAVVPFVGCAADGMTGPEPAPSGAPRRLPIDPGVAARLAYYAGPPMVGALAPRGWHCFYVYGSSGWILYITPTDIAGQGGDFGKWQRITGPAVILTHLDIDTSGRFPAAQIIARALPAHRQFVLDVIDPSMMSASSVHFKPYAADVMHYLSQDMVEYQTHANREGLGTFFRPKAHANPISGVVSLRPHEQGSPSLQHLSVDLPPDLAELTQVILHQLEAETR